MSPSSNSKSSLNKDKLLVTLISYAMLRTWVVVKRSLRLGGLVGLMQAICWWVLDWGLEDTNSCNLHIKVTPQSYKVIYIYIYIYIYS